MKHPITDSWRALTWDSAPRLRDLCFDPNLDLDGRLSQPLLVHYVQVV